MNYERIIMTLLPVVLQSLPPDYLKRLIDKILDSVEDYVKKTDTKTDDIVLVLTQVIRQQLQIPEYDDESTN